MENKRQVKAQPAPLGSHNEMEQRVRAFDWVKTPLGAMETWSQSLTTAVNICLNSRFPMVIWWGRDLTLIYNDGWRPILGVNKDRIALGSRGEDVWPEVWDVLAPMFNQVLSKGKATWSDDGLLLVNRYGFTEEAYFTWSYSPIRDDDGSIGGVFTAVTETTGRVIGERRLKTLRDLSERSLLVAKTAELACQSAAESLAKNRYDIPFALIYLLNESGNEATLCSPVGLQGGTAPAPRHVTLKHATDVWNFHGVLSTGKMEIIEDLSQKFGPLTAGAWDDDQTQRAVVAPLAKAGVQEFPAGFLVVGLSPRLTFDDDYCSFLELVAGHTATAIANARAYEEERKRAEALAELDRAKTAFFSNVSHEFRTPLTLMLGPLEDTLTEDKLPSPARARLTVAHRNSQRLLKLVNMLLDFARIEAGRIEAVYEPVDLATVTTELASVFRSAIERAGMKFVIDCAPLEQPVYVDCEMWEKIVFNLLSNAFKFTFEGEIKVTLRQVEDKVELAVSDTGTGIPAEELPNLFERFYRVKNARGRSYEGSGIGLALVQELVWLHGGTVHVRSELDRGSTFFVTLPTGSAHLPAERIGAARTLPSTGLQGKAFVEEALRWLPEGKEEEARADEEKKGNKNFTFLSSSSLGSSLLPYPASSSSSAPPRILLADDNADMRDYLRRLLIGTGYDVVAVGHGEAAITAAREHSFDLVLADVMMPRLDGFGLLKALRAEERTRGIPVILLSARAGEEARIEGMEAGADDYLTKPFSARELLARMEAHLKLHRLRRESSAALRQSEERLRAMFAQVGVGMVLLDTDCTMQQVNPKFCQIVGYDASELLGRMCLELTYEEDKAENTRVIKRLTNSNDETASLEKRYVRRDGTLVWVRINLAKIANANPAQQQLIGVVEDITERKAAEARIQAQTERLQALAQTALALTTAADLHTQLQIITDAARQIVGAHQSVTSLTISDNWSQAVNAVSLSDKYADWHGYNTPPDGTGIYRLVCEQNKPLRLTQEQLATHSAYHGFGQHAEQHPPMRGWLAVPLVGSNGRNIGLIQLSDKTDGEFTVEDEAILVQLAQLASAIIERSQAEEKARRITRFNAFRVTLTDALRPLADATEIQATASRVLGEHLGANRVVYFEVRGTDYFVERDYTNGVAGISGSFPMASFGNKLLTTYRTGQTVVASDVKTDPDLSPPEQAAFAAIQTGSYIGVPLIKGGEFVAGLSVQVTTARAWTPAEIALAEETAERTWAAVERARAEQALRESEERYRSLVSVLTDVPWTTDATGAYVEMQMAWADYTGQTWEEMRGFGWADALHPEDRTSILKIWEKAVREESVYEAQGRVWHAASQGYRYFIARAAPLRNADGSVRQWVGTCTDVHARKQAEQQIAGQNRTLEALAVGKDLTEILALTTRSLESILPGSRASVLLADAEGKQLFTGYSASLPAAYNAAIEGLTIGEGVGSCGTAAFRRQPVIVADIAHDALWKDYRDLAAEHHLAACWSLPILAPDDKLLGTFGVYFAQPRVPSEEELLLLNSATRAAGIAIHRKQTEERLRESEERFRNMADNAPVMVWVTEANGSCSFLSQSWYEFTGQTPATGLGFGWLDATHPEDKQRASEEFFAANKKYAPFRVEYRLRRRDGLYAWALDSARPRFSGTGKFLGYIGSVIDISERKQMELEREQLLMREQQARALAEDANRAKDEWLAMVSHELRTPLNAILGHARLLDQQRAGRPPELVEFAHLVRRNGERQNEIINDLLDTARMMTGKLHLELAPLNLALVVQDALVAVQPSARARNLTLRSTLEAGAGVMTGDATRLHQVVLNLLTNAIKFTPINGTVEISLRREQQDIILAVKDSGQGIPPDFLPHIFERFSQADTSRSRRHGGLGLGLALVKQIVELHGGTITATSEGAGQGATFTVTLPLCAPQTVVPQTQLAAETSTEESGVQLLESPCLTGARVLVVDDQEDARTLVDRALSEWGAAVQTATSGQEALDLLDEQSFDVLVCDIAMPDEDGYEVMRRIRAREYERGITFAQRLPAIALTAMAGTEDRLRALSAGYQRHIPKPVELVELAMVITSLLDLRQDTTQTNRK
ncbi:MAG TPA: PAS domain S-box protein [Blastocatellia bacterium]|nr:PAS domain S-box protein [Blastocatellia bacterium]